MSFQFVPVDEETKALMQEFRDKYESLCIDIKAYVPSGRGQALAITNLEQSAMWLNKAITKND